MFQTYRAVRVRKPSAKRDCQYDPRNPGAVNKSCQPIHATNMSKARHVRLWRRAALLSGTVGRRLDDIFANAIHPRRSPDRSQGPEWVKSVAAARGLQYAHFRCPSKAMAGRRNVACREGPLSDVRRAYVPPSGSSGRAVAVTRTGS